MEITPVVFFVYNRPEFTAKVFEKIKDRAPQKLIVVADGPKPGEEQLCQNVRDIATQISWTCECETHFSNHNMGCAERIISGLNHVFEQHEAAIILEDDCVPSADFFRFCEELIPIYKDDARVGLITGDNFYPEPGPYSYYFSLSCHVWGWATWRSSWRRYDRTLRNWPEIRDQGFMNELFDDPQIRDLWVNGFNSSITGNTWDTQLFYTNLINGCYTVTPYSNLVQNIGGGTVPITDMSFPVRHPPCMIRMLSLETRDFRRYLK